MTPGDHLMLMSDGGQAIRIEANTVRMTGRASMGVKLMDLDAAENVTSCFPVIEDDEDTPEA